MRRVLSLGFFLTLSAFASGQELAFLFPTNMETAQRVGWDKVWEQRSRPAPQPTEP